MARERGVLVGSWRGQKPRVKRPPKVAVLGGGIAGLTAVHELVRCGFDQIDVYDRLPDFGGKARSMPATGPVAGLPGEHGFRIYGAFYKHLFDTLRNIKSDRKGNVYNHLQPSVACEYLQVDKKPVHLPTRVGLRWKEYKALFFEVPKALERGELRHFVFRMLRFLTSCNRRRLEEYEAISWWDFLDCDHKSKAFKKLAAQGITRSLVAMQARVASTKTVGVILSQLLLRLALPWRHMCSVLDGPTSDVWLTPWVKQLEKAGVRFHPNHELTRLSFNSKTKKIQSAELTNPNGSFEMEADYYILAVPLEVAARVLERTKAIRKNAPSLANLHRLQVEWMSGIQFYLKRDIPLVYGHSIYADSPWALTSVSQVQFWADGLKPYANGGKPGGNGQGQPNYAHEVKGVLSVIASDWDARCEGFEHDSPEAKWCTEEEYKQEVWNQLTGHLQDEEGEQLKKEDLVWAFADPAIRFARDQDGNLRTAAARAETADEKMCRRRCRQTVQQVLEDEPDDYDQQNPTMSREMAANDSPLLINTVNSWQFRPNASTEIPNLMLAADYVRTYTDIATMEAANEAGRRAVNGILDQQREIQRKADEEAKTRAWEASGEDPKRYRELLREPPEEVEFGLNVPRSHVWPLKEPLIFAPFKYIDRRIFRRRQRGAGREFY
jgi:uncharacterized protein with NAD-binding domain and iron-sulfur cluster